MELPKNRHYNLDKETSTLYFEDREPGEFYMRGAIFWPEAGSGFAIMAGLEIDTGKVHIFEQRSFLTVENILKPDRTIEYEGVAAWFNRCWSRYFADSYFWNQDVQLEKRFRLQVIRSQMIEPKPHFIEAPFGDENEARHLSFEYGRTGRLLIEKDSELAQQLELSEHDEKTQYPAVRALGRLLIGLERYPFRRNL